VKAWSVREVLAFLDRVEPVLGRMSYFELLDVGTDAGDDDVQRAFHGMAASLHPDRHRQGLTVGQRERLTIVYARIAEAYRVLRDAPGREAYRHAHPPAIAGEPAVAAELGDEEHLARLHPKAQSLYRRAQAALRTGDRTSALLNLRMALAANPTSTWLRAALDRVEGK
jgi:curved DNA-binding protein CbpA